jgi:uncharacterized protein
VAAHFTLLAAVLLGLLGFGVGVFGTLVGAGGGFILTPILLLVYPETTPALLTAISLIVVFFNAGSGSLAYARMRRIDYRSGAAFALCTLPGALLGVLVADKIRRPGFDVIMGVALSGLAWWLVRGRRQPPGSHPGRGAPRTIVGRDGKQYRLPRECSTGSAQRRGRLRVELPGDRRRCRSRAAAGHRARLPDPRGDRDLALRPAWMALVATLTHVAAGTFQHGVGLRRAAALSVGVVFGAQLGAALSQRLSGTMIQRLLAVALLALGLRLVASVVL